MNVENRAFPVSKWLTVSIINFCLVALAGVTLRYKINYALPVVNQKNLLHGHSNFAFTGWVTVVLMTLTVYYLQKQKAEFTPGKYNTIIGLNCVFAYGLFISFIIEGYDVFSLTFTCLSILTSYVFIGAYYSDLKKVTDPSLAPWWLKASLVLWAISSLGAITIAYLMANTILIQDWYFGSIYFFLHFQYNGWFLFACFALLFYTLYIKGRLKDSAINKKLFFMMAITVVPAYILSIFWLKLPLVLHWIGIVAGFLQLFVLIYFVGLFFKIKKTGTERFSPVTKALWIMAGIAFILKIILQLLSIFPDLSSYAFGYRPIIIGYLHLSFLGIISFFILGYINEISASLQRRFSSIGVFIFVFGVLAQELILMFQGLEALQVEPLPFANKALFYCAVIIFTGLLWTLISFVRNKKSTEVIENKF